MAVLQRKELEESPLADLHAIASELGLEGFRALRKADLVGAILAAQGGEEDTPVEEAVDAADEPAPPEPEREAEPEPELEPEAEPEPEPAPEEETGTGVLDILPNGSGFVRVDPSGQSRNDIYVSPAQIRRCELRAGDEVSGPMRPPRRNERHPSLVRVESVNGGDPESPEERPRFGDLTPVFPTEKLTEIRGVPIGKGARVAIGGAPGAGATTLLRKVLGSLAGSDLRLAVALVGSRPEEVGEWNTNADVPVYGGAFDRSTETQVQAAELAVERAKRVVERGGDAVLIVDSLEPLPGGAQRRIFGAARNVDGGGSLTVIAATGNAAEPLRWATARVVLEAPDASGALRADLLS